MRVLRTEMYFPREQIVGLYSTRRAHAQNPGLGFAWLHTDGDTRGIEEQLLRGEEAAVIFLDAAIRGYPFKFFEVLDLRPPANPEIVRYVMAADIVIENSPPQAITFRSLLAKAPGVAIGAFIGMQAAGDVPMLMLLTVPGGIVACSSAIGVSKALEKGLNKMVERLMHRN